MLNPYSKLHDLRVFSLILSVVVTFSVVSSDVLVHAKSFSSVLCYDE